MLLGFFNEEAVRERDADFYFDNFGQFVGEAPPEAIDGKTHGLFFQLSNASFCFMDFRTQAALLQRNDLPR